VDGTFDTVNCAGGLQPDDEPVTINNAVYDVTTFVAQLDINNGTPLPAGLYRLFICGTTSITDPAGTTFLNNHTADSLVTFTVNASRTGGRSAKVKTLPATGFAPGVITYLPAQPADLSYADEGMQLEIPALGLTLPIVGIPGPDWDVRWLGKNIGYLQGTAFPTWKGNSVLTSHATDANGKPGPFADLGKLVWGDRIIIHAWGQQYIYEVRSVDLKTDPNDTSLLTKHEELSWLTLITCRGYDEKTRSYRWRTVVRAVLVQVK
jgi:LPXTG-site transpeptidase (sortase) family protein